MNQKFVIYFSDILGHQVRDEKNRRVGYVCDIGLKMNGEIYPKAAQLIIKKGLFHRRYGSIDWEQIGFIDGVIRLKVSRGQIVFQDKRIKSDFSLCIDILDQQIVDINNRKVVRVNDIHFLKVDNHLYVAHVDVGTRGLVRRLGYIQWTDKIVRLFSPYSFFLTQEDFISWKNTQLLSIGRVKNVLRLDVTQQKLSQIPSTDLADIMEDLDVFERVHLFRQFEAGLQTKIFADMAVAKKGELITSLEEKEVINLLETIPSDEAVDLLSRLPKRKSRQLMKILGTKTSKKLQKLLGFSSKSAGGLMTAECLTLPQTAYAHDALQKVKENTHFPGNIYYIYLVDELNKLVGFVPLRNFINAGPMTPLIEVMEPHKIFVRTDDGLEKVALLLEKYKFSVIPVVNEENVLLGVIAVDDVMEELIALTWKKYKDHL